MEKVITQNENTNIETSEKQNATLDNSNATPVGRDSAMDISSLLKASKEEPVKEKSNLEKMKDAKENGSLGMVVTNEALQKSNEEKKIIANKSEADALSEIDAYNAEQDKLINAAKQLNIKNRPTNAEDMVGLIDTLEHVANGGEIPDGSNGEKIIFEEKENSAENKSESSETPEEKISEQKQNIVNILIDKTGLGGEFKFTDEEKEKIVAANEIRLKEVEEVDLSTIKIKKAEKSFIESVEEFQISSSKVPVVFPASRFRAYMTGLSYGEMGDIALNGENVTFDQIHKKLTVIYNKMINPSCGKFESFEDFLRKFAYVDIDLAVYGLVVATFPEVDEIPLTCNNQTCKKSFNHKFSPRTLIRFENSHEHFLSAMKSVIECGAADFDQLVEESPIRTHKRVKLPYSKFIIEVGVASSYDYLYTIVENMIGDKFSENHPDDVNGILQLNSALLGLIRAVYVPDGDSYVQYTDFEDMIHALYMVKPEEISILSSLLQKYTDSYSTIFQLTDITCPHCGTKTHHIDLDINYLVFLKYQRLMSTEVNIDNISVL